MTEGEENLIKYRAVKKKTKPDNSIMMDNTYTIK